MPHSPTNTSSSIEAPSDITTNPTSESMRSRMRASLQRTQTRNDEWSHHDDAESTFSILGWFRSLRSKRKGKMDGLERKSGVGLRSQSPPRLPELGLDGARLELETGFSGQERHGQE
ncbi:hypothetical protein N7520_010937 [Penicillium odoratum]|uniref:uncharacterized protein n=1 Tax=Penicillium odoratum TaxID=1167516 RepID=UPI002548B232|nr:uncharacterized protein N7520_010937 [Penicillium odoratum]KAJ5745755.1 hypothetical protein N7520_010937 [Penicillium odoratum]